MSGTIKEAITGAFGHGQTWTGAGLVVMAPLLYIGAKMLLGDVDNILAGLIGAISALGSQMMGSGVMNRVRREQSGTPANSTTGNGA
jgi:hypothetical protein